MAWLVPAFALAANVPDWPLPSWGHDRYDISHSLFVSLGAMALLGVVLALARRWIGRPLPPRSVFAGIAVAWLSHFALDGFYNHGRGIAIYWPLSEGRLDLSFSSWFANLQGGWSLSAHNLQVLTIEALFFGSVLLLGLAIRRIRAARQ